MATESEVSAVETKQRLSGEQLKQVLLDLRKSIDNLNKITLDLIPADMDVDLGEGKRISRAQLKKVMQANDRVLAQTATAVGRGVRRRAAGAERTAGRTGGLGKPNLYSMELASFLATANLGKVDPQNPKSEDLAAVVKRSALGKHGVATNHTLGRLFSRLVGASGFKDATNGQFINFPAGYLEKHLPNAVAALKKEGKLPTQWSYINVSALAAASMVKKDALDEKQKELLVQHAETASALDTLTAEVLARSKSDKAAAPVVPQVLAPPAGGRQRSPPKQPKA
jgi:hypothetical protein